MTLISMRAERGNVMYKNKGLIIKKLAVILLAVVVAVTFTPLLGDGSYAASSKSDRKYDEKVKYVEKDSNGNEKELDPEIFTDKGKVLNADELENLGISVEPESAGLEPKTAPQDEMSLEDESWEAEVLSDEEARKLNKEFGIKEVVSVEESPLSDEEIADMEKLKAEDPGVSVASEDEDNMAAIQAYVPPAVWVTPDKGSGTVNLTGTITSEEKYYFGVIKVDNQTVTDIMNKNLNYNINMRNYSYGVHTVYVEVYLRESNNNRKHIDWMYKTNVPFYMYFAPTSAGSFAVYSTYMDYMPTNFMSGGLAIRMQYSADGVNWAESGYMPNYYQTYTIGGLSPSTTYQTRIYFYQTNPIGGHYYNGAETGSFLYTGSYTTGRASLPKVKSVKVKAAKVKKRKAGVYGWYTGYYFGSVKYYTYKIKVTVQFKKKPGLNGLYINGAWKPGNKKKYTLTLGPYANYSKPRGKKFNVYLYSAVAPGGYGGYSPMVAQTKKVK